ncbi:MAG TPA: DUF3054 domain-containing protein [Acidimicrobiales bacterium]|jgi:hypothetical protein|nr:DUF3054 domain-containing protein [Acidimicrobiales bacterium]
MIADSCRRAVRRWPPTLVIDLVAVVVFVLVGRHVHGHNLSLAGMLSTLWPFLSGLGLGWLALGTIGRGGASLTAGLVVWVTTVAVGMTLRVVSGQGTVLAFILVALAYFGATMLGWRLVTVSLRRRRQRPV